MSTLEEAGATGSWVGERLGVGLTLAAEVRQAETLGDPVEIGLRINQNRAQLLVSRLLGKHVPVPVGTVLAAGGMLGDAVRAACAGATPVVVGFAETATGLGHAVASVAAADGTPAPYLHTTRRPLPQGAARVEFREEHSHATEQTLAVLDDTALRTDAPLVLVDDELSTGRTALNAVRALHARWPRRTYVLASLLDSRTAEQHEQVREQVAALGAEVASVMLFAGAVSLPADVLERAGRLRAALPPAGAERAQLARVHVPVHTLGIRLDVPTAAHGWAAADEARARAGLDGLAAGLPVHRDARTLVLGDEEFLYLPQLLAAALGPQVRTSSTTRSPAVALDVPGYPLRTALRFAATDDPQRAAFAYNVAPSARPDPGNAPGFDDVVLVTDVHGAARRPHVRAGLLAQLAAVARRSVHVVTISTGSADSPEQGSGC